MLYSLYCFFVPGLSRVKGTLWQKYKLGLKVLFFIEKNDGNTHFVQNFGFGHLAHLVYTELREITNEFFSLCARWPKPNSLVSVAQFSRHFWLSWPGGAEMGKMSFTIVFVYGNYNFKAQLVILPQDPIKFNVSRGNFLLFSWFIFFAVFVMR